MIEQSGYKPIIYFAPDMRGYGSKPKPYGGDGKGPTQFIPELKFRVAAVTRGYDALDIKPIEGTPAEKLAILLARIDSLVGVGNRAPMTPGQSVALSMEFGVDTVQIAVETGRLTL